MKYSTISSVSKKRAALNRQRAKFVRQVLSEVPYCEAHLTGCTHRATDVHEILTRARGGSILDRANVAALCRRCHGFITVHPEWSQANGWMLSSWSTESDVEEAARKRREQFFADRAPDQDGQGESKSVA